MSRACCCVFSRNVFSQGFVSLRGLLLLVEQAFLFSAPTALLGIRGEAEFYSNMQI
jgi:hypothetical protein